MEVLLLTLGSYLVSLGINLFLLPHKMSTGGASGIATILYYTFNIPMSVTILVLNLPLFLISILNLGKNFTIKTIYSTVVLSLFLEIFKYNNIYSKAAALSPTIAVDMKRIKKFIHNSKNVIQRKEPILSDIHFLGGIC